MPQKVQKLYVLVSDSLMQVSFAGFLSLPALYVVVCSTSALCNIGRIFRAISRAIVRSSTACRYGIAGDDPIVTIARVQPDWSSLSLLNLLSNSHSARRS